MNNKLIDGKMVLRAVGLAFSAIGLVAQLCSSVANSKREQLEIKEAVQKEVARQLALPMKRDP